MPRPTVAHTDFTSGEISPKLLGRVDLDQYDKGARSLEGFMVQKHGGAHTKPGTRYIAEPKDTTKTVRLVRFQVSVTQGYTLELGDFTMRFYRDRGRLVQAAGDPSPGDVTEIATPWPHTALAELKWAQSQDKMWFAHPDYQPREFSRGAGNDTDPATWTLAAYTFDDGPYLKSDVQSRTLAPSHTSGNGRTITAAGGDVFVSTDVGRLIRIRHGVVWGTAVVTAFVSATEVTVNITHDFGATSASNDWLLGAWGETTGWPWKPEWHQQRLWWGGTDTEPHAHHSTETGTLNKFAPSRRNDSVVLATSAISYRLDDSEVNGIRGMVSDTEGLIILTEGGLFVGVGGADNISVEPNNYLTKRQGSAAAHETAHEVQVDDTILFVEKGGRKLREFEFNDTRARFIARDLSLVSEHITYSGIKETAFQLRPDQILWMVLNNGQLVGFTYERDQGVIAWHHHIAAGDLEGSEYAEVESIAAIHDRTIDRDILYLCVKRTINGVDTRQIEWMEKAYERGDDPESGVFYVECGLSYDQRAAISGATNANPIQITQTAHGYTTDDTVRIRDVEGMVEINDRSFEVDVVDANTYELRGENSTDHGVYQAGTGTAGLETEAVSGLDHLEGETVAVVRDGATHGSKVVKSGAITLDDPGSIVHVGLFRTKDMLLVPPVSRESVSLLHATAQTWRLSIRMVDSLGGVVGEEGRSLYPLVQRVVDDRMDQRVPLFTGVDDGHTATLADREQRIQIQQDVPLPLTILSVTHKMDAGND